MSNGTESEVTLKKHFCFETNAKYCYKPTMMAMKSINAEEKDDDRKKCEDDNEGKARQYHGEERNGMRGTIIIIILHLHTLTLSIYFGRKHVQRKLKLNEK